MVPANTSGGGKPEMQRKSCNAKWLQILKSHKRHQLLFSTTPAGHTLANRSGHNVVQHAFGNSNTIPIQHVTGAS